jgi:hypothetical protein
MVERLLITCTDCPLYVPLRAYHDTDSRTCQGVKPPSIKHACPAGEGLLRYEKGQAEKMAFIENIRSRDIRKAAFLP